MKKTLKPAEKKQKLTVVVAQPPLSSADPNGFPHQGQIILDGKIAATFNASTPEEYERVKRVLEAGFRLESKTRSWGMKAEDSWQLRSFPSDPDDWKSRMQRLAEHRLLDDDKSEMESLMHCCTWTLEQLWKWMHDLALNSKNPNIKRDAGMTLGKLYYQAKQVQPDAQLRTANEEFERQVVPFGGAKRKPSPDLVRWVNAKMMWQYEYWKRAVEVAHRFEEKRPYSRDVVGGKGDHYFNERLPITTIAEAWEGYFIQERQNQLYSAAWNQFLDELERHAFCTNKLNLAQLTEFESCWKGALHKSLHKEWELTGEAELVKAGKDKSFIHKFGDLKHITHMEGAGYNLAKDFFERCFSAHWRQKQQHRSASKESLREAIKPKQTSSVDPTSEVVKTKAKMRKSSAG